MLLRGCGDRDGDGNDYGKKKVLKVKTTSHLIMKRVKIYL